MLNFDDVSLPTVPDLEAYAHEVSIDAKQMQIFDALQKERFVKEALQIYRDQGYTKIEPTQPWINKAVALLHEATQMGIKEDAILQEYMLLGLLLNKTPKEYTFYHTLVKLPTQEEKRDYIQQLLWQIEKERSKHGNRQ